MFVCYSCCVDIKLFELHCCCCCCCWVQVQVSLGKAQLGFQIQDIQRNLDHPLLKQLWTDQIQMFQRFTISKKQLHVGNKVSGCVYVKVTLNNTNQIIPWHRFVVVTAAFKTFVHQNNLNKQRNLLIYNKNKNDI